MKAPATTSIVIGWAILGLPVMAQVSTAQVPKDRADLRQMVRGDTGKWNDEAKLQHAPPIHRKPEGLSLDDWADQLAEKKVTTTSQDDNWLIFRTRQLDDNDRVWVESIERKGDEFTIVMSEAIWQGSYSKTFTYHEVVAVNLGKLAPGAYSVKWVVSPLVFDRFADPGKPKDNWPKDARAAKDGAVETPLRFTVSAAP
jgi:hypothetical protein